MAAAAASTANAQQRQPRDAKAPSRTSRCRRCHSIRLPVVLPYVHRVQIAGQSAGYIESHRGYAKGERNTRRYRWRRR